MAPVSGVSIHHHQEKTMITSRRWALMFGAALLGGCGAMGVHHGAGGHGHGDHRATATHGLIAMPSPHTTAETMNRLEAEVKKRNLAVVARIDHAAAAQRIGQTLRPTELLVFGNPQAGTPLMLCAQLTGIDLPMKALVWADAAGQAWLGYNDPQWVMHRHGNRDCPPAEQVGKALAAIAAAVVAK
jgi:uncharacterized protein (DUF302 family)